MLPQKAPPSLALTCWNVIGRAHPNFGSDTNANLHPIRLRVIALRSRNTMLSFRPSTRSFAHSFKSWPVVRMCVLIRSDRLTACVCLETLQLISGIYTRWVECVKHLVEYIMRYSVIYVPLSLSYNLSNAFHTSPTKGPSYKRTVGIPKNVL